MLALPLHLPPLPFTFPLQLLRLFLLLIAVVVVVVVAIYWPCLPWHLLHGIGSFNYAAAVVDVVDVVVFVPQPALSCPASANPGALPNQRQHISQFSLPSHLEPPPASAC